MARMAPRNVLAEIHKTWSSVLSHIRLHHRHPMVRIYARLIGRTPTLDTGQTRRVLIEH